MRFVTFIQVSKLPVYWEWEYSGNTTINKASCGKRILFIFVRNLLAVVYAHSANTPLFPDPDPVTRQRRF